MDYSQCGQFAIVQDDARINAQPELDFKIVQSLLVIAHRIDPRAFGRKFLLLEPAQVGLSDAPFLRQRAAAFGIFTRALEVKKTVAGRIAIAERAVVSG